jgi:hypothetical protein
MTYRYRYIHNVVCLSVAIFGDTSEIFFQELLFSTIPMIHRLPYSGNTVQTAVVPSQILPATGRGFVAVFAIIPACLEYRKEKVIQKDLVLRHSYYLHLSGGSIPDGDVILSVFLNIYSLLGLAWS